MQYYIIHNGKILIATNRDAFVNNYYTEEVFNLPEDYEPRKYIVVDGILVRNTNYEQEQAEVRRKIFESNFLTTSKGNYRLVPQGFANAQQSIDTINNMVVKLGGLPKKYADEIKFYPTPDFTNPEECTEEWLIAHQIHLEPMTLQEWDTFYIEFVDLYGQKQYKKLLGLE